MLSLATTIQSLPLATTAASWVDEGWNNWAVHAWRRLWAVRANREHERAGQLHCLACVVRLERLFAPASGHGICLRHRKRAIRMGLIGIH
jgi:hypothetical protein